MIINEKIQKIGFQLSEKFHQLFSSEQLEALAIESGFVQRSTSQLKGPEFLELMTTEILLEPEVSYDGLCDRLSELNPAIEMSGQGLEQRVNSDGAVAFLETVLEHTLSENLKTHLQTVPGELLKPFGHVYLQDSTQIRLQEVLAKHFRGSGGNASKSIMKVDFTYELHQHHLYKPLITSGIVPDQSHAGWLLDQIQGGDLVLRDLGYFHLATFRKIDQKGAFFMSRLSPNVDIFLNEEDEHPIDLVGYINKHYANLHTIDIQVYVGKEEKLPCRLIAYRLPNEIVNERGRKARQVAARKGRSLNKAYLQWLAFAFFITNVTEEIWPAKVIGTIYRIRWQVELTFKHWKSLLKIHLLKGSRPERIRCLLYGRLICIVVINMICVVAYYYAQYQHQRELSFDKLIKWILRKDRLTKAMFKNRFNTIFTKLEAKIPKVCKQKRKRPTTRELIEANTPYLDSFVNNKFQAEAA
jgi:hypothetical protein